MHTTFPKFSPLTFIISNHLRFHSCICLRHGAASQTCLQLARSLQVYENRGEQTLLTALTTVFVTHEVLRRRCAVDWLSPTQNTPAQWKAGAAVEINIPPSDPQLHQQRLQHHQQQQQQQQRQDDPYRTISSSHTTQAAHAIVRAHESALVFILGSDQADQALLRSRPVSCSATAKMVAEVLGISVPVGGTSGLVSHQLRIDFFLRHQRLQHGNIRRDRGREPETTAATSTVGFSGTVGRRVLDDTEDDDNDDTSEYQAAKLKNGYHNQFYAVSNADTEGYDADWTRLRNDMKSTFKDSESDRSNNQSIEMKRREKRSGDYPDSSGFGDVDDGWPWKPTVTVTGTGTGAGAGTRAKSESESARARTKLLENMNDLAHKTRVDQLASLLNELNNQAIRRQKMLKALLVLWDGVKKLESRMKGSNSGGGSGSGSSTASELAARTRDIQRAMIEELAQNSHSAKVSQV